jgi:murein DD-endopeptidase MepM/ murein hydrolase activator NlpD
MRITIAASLALLLATTAGAELRILSEPTPPFGSCLPAAEAEALRSAALVRPMRAQPGAMPFTTLYADPMGGGGIDSPGKTILQYVDLDPTTGLLDYNCGIRTYDGHNGDDIEIRDFYDMDEGVPILAAAPGAVIAVHDGEFDRNTTQVPGAPANYVLVQHADGSIAYYFHMRKGSVRVALNQVVGTGDTLGLIGSSGFSNKPHLHFETWAGATSEAFAGPCRVGGSLWTAQQPYVMSLPPDVISQGLTTLPISVPLILERPPTKTHAVAGAAISSWAKLRTLKPSNVVDVKVYSPLGLWLDDPASYPGPFSVTYWYEPVTLPTNASYYGTWHYDWFIDGVLQFQQSFTVDANANQLASVPPRTIHVSVNTPWMDDFNGIDPDGSVFWYEIVTPPLHGAADLSGARKRHFTYTPSADYIGQDSMVVRAQDDEGVWGPTSAIRFQVDANVGVDDGPGGGVPLLFALHASYPSPFSRSAVIAFDLPRAADVELAIFDIAGRKLRTLASGRMPAGRHQKIWDGADDAGRRAGPGLYLFRMRSGAFEATRRTVLVP